MFILLGLDYYVVLCYNKVSMNKKGMIWVSRSEITDTREAKVERFMKTTNRSEKSLNGSNGKEYMSNPNTIKFLDTVVKKSFNPDGRPYAFKSVEQLEKDMGDFLSLCYETNTIPTITAVALWLGCDRDTIYAHSNNPNSPFSDTCKKIINLCHLSMENGAVAGKINSVLYMFLSKNYFGLKDDKNITVTPATDSVNTPATMEALQKQLNEENVMNAEYEEK